MLPPLHAGASGCGSRCARPGRWRRWRCSSRSSCRCAAIDLVAERASPGGRSPGSGRRSCGSGRRRRCRRSACASCGTARPMRGGGRVRRQPFELDRHRGAAAGGGAVPGVEGRGARLAGDRADRPGDRHDVHRPPAGGGQAAGGRAPRAARARRPDGDLSRRAPAPTASGCCRSSRRSSGCSSRPELERRRRGAAGDASPTGRGPACRRPSTAGGARWTSPAHLRDVLARSTGGVVELTFHPPLPVARLRRPQGAGAGGADAGRSDRRRRGVGGAAVADAEG